jgi:beta-phosphoglucomutase-like phosphatase (HAD superfamily)
MKYQYFLDLDGVITNFLQAAFERHGETRPIEDLWPKGQWGDNETLCKLAGVETIEEFWKKLDHQFWADLPMYPDAEHILDAVAPLRPCILTSPAIGSAGGKQEWIMKNLPRYFQEGRYLIGPDKKAVSGPGKVLIDDCPENLSKWSAAGGTGILVPRYHNRLHAFRKVAHIYIYNEISWLESRRKDAEVGSGYMFYDLAALSGGEELYPGKVSFS